MRRSFNWWCRLLGCKPVGVEFEPPTYPLWCVAVECSRCGLYFGTTHKGEPLSAAREVPCV